MQNCQPSTSQITMPDYRPSLVAPVPGSPASTRAVVLDSLLDVSASEMPSPPFSPGHPGPAPPGSPVASVINLSQTHEMPGWPQRKRQIPAHYRDCQSQLLLFYSTNLPPKLNHCSLEFPVPVP